MVFLSFYTTVNELCYENDIKQHRDIPTLSMYLYFLRMLQEIFSKMNLLLQCFDFIYLVLVGLWSRSKNQVRKAGQDYGHGDYGSPCPMSSPKYIRGVTAVIL